MLKNIKVDFQEFMDVLDSCEGDVFVTTDEGDTLNLRSKLCQIIGLRMLISKGEVEIANLKCELIADESKIMRYLIYGEISK